MTHKTFQNPRSCNNIYRATTKMLVKRTDIWAMLKINLIILIHQAKIFVLLLHCWLWLKTWNKRTDFTSVEFHLIQNENYDFTDKSNILMVINFEPLSCKSSHVTFCRRDVFRILSNIKDGVLFENSSRLKAGDCFRKKLHFRCFTGFWIRLCTAP